MKEPNASGVLENSENSASGGNVTVIPVAVADLLGMAAAYNPRKMGEHDMAALRRSIRTFGPVQPIVVNRRTGRIVGGHQRVKAAQAEGFEALPTTYVDLDEAGEKQLNLALNRIHGEWDQDLLAKVVAELKSGNVDLEMTGLTAEEIDALLYGGKSASEVEPDAIPDPPDEPFTQPGDLIILGKHRLFCGDSSKPEDVARLLDGARIHLVNTDPPYNVKVEPRSNNAIAAGIARLAGDSDPLPRLQKKRKTETHHQGLDLARHPEKAKPTGKMRARDRVLDNDFISDDDFRLRLREWFKNLSDALEPGRAFYIWGGYSNIKNYPGAPRDGGTLLLADDHLAQAVARPDTERLHGRPRMVLSRMEKRRRPLLQPGHQQRDGCLVGEEGLASLDGPPHGEARRARNSCDDLLLEARRERPGPLRRIRVDAHRRGDGRPTCVPDGDRPGILRCCVHQVAGIHGPEGRWMEGERLMGRRGPPPKPTKLRLVEGNPSKRPINTREPKPPRTLAVCPEWLSDEAKKAWKRMAPMLRKMGLLTQADVDALAGYCQSYSRWKAAELFIAANGETYPLRDQAGKVRCVQQWPQVSIARSELKIMRDYQQEFGLTPAARSRIFVGATPGKPDGEEEVAQRLLTGA